MHTLSSGLFSLPDRCRNCSHTPQSASFATTQNFWLAAGVVVVIYFGRDSPDHRDPNSVGVLSSTRPFLHFRACPQARPHTRNKWPLRCRTPPKLRCCDGGHVWGNACPHGSGIVLGWHGKVECRRWNGSGRGVLGICRGYIWVLVLKNQERRCSHAE